MALKKEDLLRLGIPSKLFFFPYNIHSLQYCFNSGQQIILQQGDEKFNIILYLKGTPITAYHLMFNSPLATGF